jgi:hypothetical protein
MLLKNHIVCLEEIAILTYNCYQSLILSEKQGLFFNTRQTRLLLANLGGKIQSLCTLSKHPEQK